MSAQSGGSEDGGSGKKVIIQKLLLQIDLKKIKDLQTLLEILQEAEDYADGISGEDEGDDPDAVPVPV